MTRDITPAGWPATGAVDEAFAEVRASFDRFCLAAGIEALGTMMEADVTAACGPRHGRDAARRAHRWGRTQGRIGFHGGKIEVERPRVRGVDGGEVTIPSWETAAQEDWLGRWAMNLMLINVSTRRFGRAVRLPEGHVPAPPGPGVSKSAASRRFVALSAARLADFMAADLSALDLLVVQIDGLHLGDDLVLVAAIGVDGEGNKHPLALVEGATQNAATVQALLDNLVSRGLDPTVPTLFIADGAKALSKAIRRTFGSAAAIQRCQIHKARNIMERLPKDRVLRQAWELDDADKAEKLIRNLARRLDQQCPGVAASILEGLDEILTVVRLKLPKELRRSLACTNIAENMMGTIRRVTRNAERWRDAGMALRWGAAGMIEANKGFRRLKAHKQLSVLRAALQAHHDRMTIKLVAHVSRAA
ncbi:IS256 family transposase [Bradyrhizobium septentrionale]|uniref:Mutator family transposase n=1 Tax=Bradyrhizobium septentrionale TaxID=1404411 RepID=A0A974A5B6_9BRAD|nr:MULTISPECIES: IS256 family transposase [Bradyrhizobium]MCK7667445.1 IS256 family transposase [Bradyrhizobium sp. 2S1]UGY16928.1 IS256 family transposase [Bradyrhizobium septentrionale]UGY25683.1 IS256 family transposase [Bradyrhizobium septentrionale]